MRAKIYIVCALVALVAAPVHAQEESHDPMEEYLFPPELLMLNQRAIGLDEAQRTAIKEEFHKAEAQFSPLEWDLQSELEALGGLLSEDRVDEKQALAKLDTILELEKRIKRTHLLLVVRIKNLLTAEQRAELYELKERWSESSSVE